MSLQAKSDVIRVFLLYNYGGVWLDATVCLTQSLKTWLSMDVDFTTFIRHDEVAERSSIRPWMTSWFMVSPPQGRVISALRDAVIKFWKERKRPIEYFWLHRLFSGIMSSNDSAIHEAFEPQTAVTAGPYLCHGLSDPKVPPDLPMIKIKNCKKELRDKVLAKVQKLYGKMSL